jgi:hypothetical protein
MIAWGRWGFPLPPASRDPAERGYRLARAAMQMEWQKTANEVPITQVTPPDQVHAFIDQTPGLADACREFPHYLGVYAPQLCIPGFGADFEGVFEDLYQRSCAREPRDRADSQFKLRDPVIDTYDSAEVACDFFHGYGALFGPSASYYELPEYLAWLLSDTSEFLPDAIRSVLTVGMARWGVWPWSEYELNPLDEFGYERADSDGHLKRELVAADSVAAFRPTAEAVADAIHRMSFSAGLLGLPESGDQLAERLLASDFLGPYFAGRDR